jgi:hypothetical protein
MELRTLTLTQDDADMIADYLEPVIADQKFWAGTLFGMNLERLQLCYRQLTGHHLDRPQQEAVWELTRKEYEASNNKAMTHAA